MKYLAAYALLVLGGKAQPSKQDVEKVLNEVGAEIDKGQLDTMMKNVGDKPFHELVAGGMDKLVALPAAGAAAPATAGEAKKEEKEEEPQKEDEPEEVEMGGLFDEDDDDY